MPRVRHRAIPGIFALFALSAHVDEAGPSVLAARVAAVGLPGAAACSQVGRFFVGMPGRRAQGQASKSVRL
jgi:hypothetical protein